MDRRIARTLAAGTFLALPLLTACGTSTAPAGTSAPPAAPAASSSGTTPAAASPTPTAAPVDDTKQVQAASKKFVEVGFGLGGSVDSSKAWAARVKPLMTEQGYTKLDGEATIDKTIASVRGQAGKDGRTVTGLVGPAKVTKLDTAAATVDVKFQSRLQKPDGSGWETLRKSPVETGTLGLVKQGGVWLVDDAG